ncbi:MAG: phosphotransferase [Azoarcus sp.]|nr:phosphotransferase [Azoarcus sp.]
MQRRAQLDSWLATTLPGRRLELAPASADASFRRYFRVSLPDEGETLIVMDAPPEHEDCRPWLAVAALFAEAGAHVPQVHAEDVEQGFILMSDLGDTTYLQVLNADSAAHLYADALGTLIAIQAASRPGVLPEYSRELLEREMRLFDQWYVERHHGVSLTETEHAALEKVYARVLDTNLAEPQVFVHRDYHSRNLMHLPGGANPGVIDFQDAVFGPITYDLVSLFKDAYIRWDEEFELDLLIRYWEAARGLGLPVGEDFPEFHRAYEWMGVQRHLKVLGIFARLAMRDGKTRYLDDMPVVLNHLRRVCGRYGDLRPLARLLERLAPESTTVGYTF